MPINPPPLTGDANLDRWLNLLLKQVNNPNTSTISGGNIDNTAIGVTTPSTGVFTALGATSGSFTTLGASSYIGVGGAAPAGVALANIKNITGATTSYANYVVTNVQSDVTTKATGYVSSIGTQAAAFTLSVLEHYRAQQQTIGAASTVTTQYGFNVDASLIGATNNYGFVGNIPAATGRYNLYMVGTAQNYIAGDVQLGKTVTAAGTTGAQTINKTVGTVNFAALDTSLVVTNSLVTVNSIITATVGTADTTMKSVAAVAAPGSFTLYANAAATAETRVDFHVFN